MRYLVFGETDPEIHLLDLVLEEVFLVEEEDDRCVLEVLVVDDLSEQCQRLIHPVHSLVVFKLK